MNIKEAEKLTGISRRNIRFYEQKGMLHPARNQDNDYRDYSPQDIQRLKLIRALRMVDMPLEEIREVVEGKASIDPTQCNRCGRCIKACPFHALEAQTTGYRVYVGGRWGKRTAMGHALDTIFTDKEQVLDLVEKCLLFFKAYGQPKERFSDTISRIGFDKVQEMLLSNELLERKEEILAQPNP